MYESGWYCLERSTEKTDWLTSHQPAVNLEKEKGKRKKIGDVDTVFRYDCRFDRTTTRSKFLEVVPLEESVVASDPA